MGALHTALSEETKPALIEMVICNRMAIQNLRYRLAQMSVVATTSTAVLGAVALDAKLAASGFLLSGLLASSQVGFVMRNLPRFKAEWHWFRLRVLIWRMRATSPGTPEAIAMINLYEKALKARKK